MTIFDKIERVNENLGNLVFKEFMNGEYGVTQTSYYYDPKGTERYEVYEQNALRGHEQDTLFSVVKYPKWYAELEGVFEISVEGVLSEAINWVCQYDDFEQDLLDRAKELAEKGSVEFIAPDNLKDYKKWYKEHKTKCLEQY